MKKKNIIPLWSIVMLISLTIIMPLTGYAADKFVVKDAAGTTKFVVTDTGSVGVGTALPLADLHVSSSLSATRGIIAAQNSDNAWASLLTFKKSRGTEGAPQAVATGDFLGFAVAQSFDGTKFVRSGGFGFRVDGPVSSSSIPVAMDIVTGTGEQGPTAYGYARLTVTSSGYIGIGTQAPAYPLHMASGARVTTGGVWTNASSREYKENIKELTTAEAIDTLAKLDPVKYNYKVDKEDKHVGFIAEDVPVLVATSDRKGLSPMDIVAVLTKVVQEQQTTISQLSDKVSQLQREMKLRGSIASN